MKFNPNCAGFLVFIKDFDKILLVFNHNNVPSFPKGKRERHGNRRKTAIRELNEETGLTENDLCLIPEIVSGKAGEIYLATTTLNDPHFNFYPKDKEVRLIPIEEALKILPPKRQTVLTATLEKLKINIPSKN